MNSSYEREVKRLQRLQRSQAIKDFMIGAAVGIVVASAYWLVMG